MNIEKLRGIWDAHSKAIYGYLLRLTKSEADACDFLQDLFHRLARQPELLERLDEEPRGYLLRLARNAVIDQARRVDVRERVFERINASRPKETVDAEDPDNKMLRDALVDAMRHLEKDQREVVYRKLWKRQTFDEMARELGVSINTAASRYRYGIDKMRGLLRSLYEDFAPKAPKTLTTPIPKMKTNPKNPITTLNVEDPIIQPLEQRRVPSATGAPLGIAALPVPEDTNDGSADPVDVSSDTEVTDVVIDDQAGDEGIDVGDAGDDVPVDEVIEVDPPMSFDDVIQDVGFETDGTLTLDAPVDAYWAYSQIFESGPAETADGGPVLLGATGDATVDFDDGGFVPVSIQPNIYFGLNPDAVSDDGTMVDDGTVVDDGGSQIMYFGAMGGVGMDDGGQDPGLDGAVDHPNVFHALNPDAVLDDGTVVDDGTVDHGVTADDGSHAGDGSTDGEHDVLVKFDGGPIRYTFGGGTLDGGEDGGIVVNHFGGVLHSTQDGEASSEGSVDFHPEWAYRGHSDPASESGGELPVMMESQMGNYDLASMSGAPVESALSPASHDAAAGSDHLEVQHDAAPAHAGFAAQAEVPALHSEAVAHTEAAHAAPVAGEAFVVDAGHPADHAPTASDAHAGTIAVSPVQGASHAAVQMFDQAPAHSAFLPSMDVHEVAGPAHHDAHDFSVESLPIHGTVDHWVPLHENATDHIPSADPGHNPTAHDDFIPLDHHSDHETPVAYTPDAANGADAMSEAAHASIGGSPAAMAAAGAALLGVEPKRRDKSAQG